MFSQYSLLGDVEWKDWFRIIYHAFSLDFAVASYLIAGLGIILVCSFFIKSRISQRIVNAYTCLLLCVALLIIIADLFTFPSWRFHIDKIVFFYIDNPKDVLACAQWWVWIGGFLGLGIVTYLTYSLFKHCMQWNKYRDIYFSESVGGMRFAHAFFMLLITGSLFLPIRGGITVSTSNSGQVYFSDNQMLNIAAINPVFNMFESLQTPNFDTKKYTYMSSDQASAYVEEMLQSKNSPFDTSVIKKNRPNILLFIVESLSANPLSVYSGCEAYTPYLNKYVREGLFFQNAYASSFRTDRGVVAVLSCFPGQPTSSLMLVPKKCSNLTYWTKDLSQNGYQLKFYYGGDENFARMRSYLINAGFTNRVCDRDFPISQRLSKWGVHDHVLFDYVFNDIVSQHSDTTPYLDVVLTLSSHEPFEVPMHHFSNPYLNSLAYTDSCLGNFIERFKQTRLWDSTLIIIAADHGFAYPNTLTNYDLDKYRIPILFLGGVLQKKQTYHHVVSQIDIGTTILALLNLHAQYQQFPFAKNMLNADHSFAFFAFNDGFALVTDTAATVIDAKLNKTVYSHPTYNEKREKQAKAFMQIIYEKIENL